MGYETDEKILIKAACGSGLAVAHPEKKVISITCF